MRCVILTNIFFVAVILFEESFGCQREYFNLNHQCFLRILKNALESFEFGLILIGFDLYLYEHCNIP